MNPPNFMLKHWPDLFQRSVKRFEGQKAYQVRLLKEHSQWLFYIFLVMFFPLWYLAINKSVTIWSLCGVSLVLVAVRLFLHQGLQRLAIWFYIGSYLVIIGAVITKSGGVFSTDAFYFVPLVAIAGLLLDVREGLAIVAGIFLYMGYLWWLEERTAALFSSGFILADVMICCVITLVTVRLAIRSLFGSLGTLEVELAHRHSVEQQLVDGKKHLNAIYEALSDSVLLVELPDGLILEANHSTGLIFDRPGEKFPGKQISHLFSSEPSVVPSVIQSALAAGQCAVEAEVSTPAGRKLWLEIACTRISHDSAQRVVLVLRDISARKQRDEEKLWYERIVNQMMEDVVYTGRDGRIQYVNPSFERNSGYTMAECVGQTSSFLKSGAHEAAFYTAMWTTISSGGTWAGVFINRTKDGNLIHQETIISPVMGQDDRILGYLAIKRDITEKLELERRYVQAQKMEAIGTLAGGVAHDFNNILCSIIGFTELAKIDAAEAHDLCDKLDHVLASSYRARDLVSRILTFSRHENQTRKPVQVVEIIKEVIDLLKPALTSSVALSAELAPGLPPVLMDPSQFHQIMMNLATNAAHAMRGMGAPRLSLRARLEDAPPHITLGTPTLQAGRTLLVEVQDNGHGMSHAVLSRIFEPFYTTKPQGEGTGLGLSVVHGIVKDAGGSIQVSSTEGQGTLFQLYFPAVDAAAQDPESKPEFRFVGKQQRVLFVDDEEFLCTLMRKLLASFNLKVSVVSNPVQALEIIRSGEAFDLVISDFTMPGMTGLGIAQELWARQPNVPFILASGLIKAEIRAELEQAGVHYILPKPFTAASVAVAISECLGGSVS